MTNPIVKLQETMKALPDELKIDPLIENFFSDGIYCRMMSMKAGETVVGYTHKHNHLAVLLSGTVTVSSKYGKATYTAPYIVHTLAGDKRAFVALSDVKYMTIHATETTDLEQLRTELVEDY